MFSTFGRLERIVAKMILNIFKLCKIRFTEMSVNNWIKRSTQPHNHTVISLFQKLSYLKSTLISLLIMSTTIGTLKQMSSQRLDWTWTKLQANNKNSWIGHGHFFFKSHGRQASKYFFVGQCLVAYVLIISKKIKCSNS